VTGSDWTYPGDASGTILTTGELWAGDARADAQERVLLELGRDPDRCDTRVARACDTNIFVVRQVRERLGAYPTRPV